MMIQVFYIRCFYSCFMNITNINMGVWTAYATAFPKYLLSLRQIYDDSNAEKPEIVSFMIKKARSSYPDENLLKNICDESHYSMPYLSSKFKQCMGISFKEYQTKIRIDTACQLLTKTNKKVFEIALAVGYKNVDFFTSVFKDKTHMTPGKFRKAALNKTTLNQI